VPRRGRSSAVLESLNENDYHLHILVQGTRRPHEATEKRVEILAITGMLMAALCWLLPLLADLRDEQGLEWRLLGVPLAASALLIWLERLGAGGLVRWGGSLGAIAFLDLCARCTVARATRLPRRWAMTSAAVLAAGLLWRNGYADNADHAARALPMTLPVLSDFDSIAASIATRTTVNMAIAATMSSAARRSGSEWGGP
jgi:hypothetical protein